MGRILIISFSDLSRDPRVHRQIRLLSRHHKVTTAGLADPCVPGVAFVGLETGRKSLPARALAAARLLTHRFDAYYHAIPTVADALSKLASQDFDLILANDPETWPLALRIRKNAKLIFDAHEYAPREIEEQLSWRLLYQGYKHWLCSRFFGLSDRQLTVCQGIAAEYGKHYRVSPCVIMNTAPRQELNIVPPEGQTLRLIHHGLATPSRKIESMIEALDLLDEGFSLDLMLVPSDPGYLRTLQARARHNARIRFLPPVEMHRIAELTNHYDAGLYLLEPTNFNSQHALPNKFFEFVQARLAIVIGPSPEMASLLRKHQLGLVADDFSPAALARAIRQLAKLGVLDFKKNAHAAADLLCWEHEGQKLVDLCNGLLQQKQAGTTKPAPEALP